LAREHFREVDEVFEDKDGDTASSDSNKSNGGMDMATKGGYRHSVMSSSTTTESASNDSSSDGGGSTNTTQAAPAHDASIDDIWETDKMPPNYSPARFIH